MADTPDQPFFSATFAEHLQQAIPEFLYHYTSQDGLLGIVQSRAIWATNISYMNDATEFGLARDRLLEEIRTRYIRKASVDVVSWITTKITDSPICVSCFCEDGDLLSQWRGYAGDGYGYSLAFIPSVSLSR
jgi:hypothetical protein